MRSIDSVTSRKNVQHVQRKKVFRRTFLPETHSIDLSTVFFGLLFFGVGIFSAFLFFTEGDDEYSKHDIFVADVSDMCQRGEWMHFPLENVAECKEQEFSGKVFVKNEKITNDAEDLFFLVGEGYSLNFYDAREVDISGCEKKDEKISYLFVEKIKCSGNDASSSVQKMRQEKLHFLTENRIEFFAQIGIEKDAQVDFEDVAFVKEDIIYVYMQNDSEISKTKKVFLLQIKEENDGYIFDKLAEYKIENGKKILVSGSDEYLAKKQTVYEYDQYLKKWSMVL